MSGGIRRVGLCRLWQTVGVGRGGSTQSPQGLSQTQDYMWGGGSPGQ